MSGNYYSILGVDSAADPDEIKRAYRELVLRYHPDRNPGDRAAEEKMKEINFVYSVLRDLDSRRAYDYSLLHGWVARARSGAERARTFCGERTASDSAGRATVVRAGQQVYYVVNLDRSILGRRYRRHELFSASVVGVVPAESEPQSERGGPLCVVGIAGQEVLVYERDFATFWLSQESYKRADVARGMTFGLLLVAVLLGGTVGVWRYLSLTPAERDQLRLVQEAYSDEKRMATDHYKATIPGVTDREIAYLRGGDYEVFVGKGTITRDADLLSVPDSLGVRVGAVPAGTEVATVMRCKRNGAVKVKVGDHSGWVGRAYLKVGRTQR